MTIARRSMACCGFCELAPRGGTYLSDMAHGRPYQVASMLGKKVDESSKCCKSYSQLADANGQLNWEMHHVDFVSSVLTNMQQGHSWGARPRESPFSR